MAREPTRHGDLEATIDAIAASYDAAEEINNLESAALPNKRAVVEAFQHLQPVIFMGFYSTRALNRAMARLLAGMNRDAEAARFFEEAERLEGK